MIATTTSLPKFLLQSLTILVFLSCNVAGFWPNNYTLIRIINTMNTTWKAGENPTDVPHRFRRNRLRPANLPVLHWDSIFTPLVFDSRNHWTKCRRIIGRIRHQGECGSCWAVAAASVISDRMCIETNGSERVHLSTEDIIRCYPHAPNETSCDGGQPGNALYLWTTQGIVSGGEVSSGEGCKPYSLASFNGEHQSCTKQCSNRRFWKQYHDDKYFGKVAYHVTSDEKAIKIEIYHHGPVASVIQVHEDLHQYKAGIYRAVMGKVQQLHAVKIIGWGEDSGMKYWLVANTWGIGYGMKGYIKFTRGENHCNIEENVVAGRMFKQMSPHAHMRQITGAVANEANVFHIEKIILYGFWIWRLKETW